MTLNSVLFTYYMKITLIIQSHIFSKLSFGRHTLKGYTHWAY